MFLFSYFSMNKEERLKFPKNAIMGENQTQVLVKNATNVPFHILTHNFFIENLNLLDKYLLVDCQG